MNEFSKSWNLQVFADKKEKKKNLMNKSSWIPALLPSDKQCLVQGRLMEFGNSEITPKEITYEPVGGGGRPNELAYNTRL